MATVGKLIVIKERSLQVEFTNAKGKDVKMPVADNQLSTNIVHAKSTDIVGLNGVEVEFDEVSGQPKNVRYRGERFSNLM